MNWSIVDSHVLVRNVSKLHSFVKGGKTCEEASFHVEANILASSSLFENEGWNFNGRASC